MPLLNRLKSRRGADAEIASGARDVAILASAIAHPRRSASVEAMNARQVLIPALAGFAGLLGCGPRQPTIPPVAHVDVERFMGDWYVIGTIPTYLERGAHNPVESYARNPDGSIATTFTFRQGAFDGPEKRYHPTGFVGDDGSNAVWGMQFVWPIKAEYLIAHLDPAYTQTIVARSARDYVWIMARQPTMSDDDYARLVAQVGAWGYDTHLVQRVPQRW